MEQVVLLLVGNAAFMAALGGLIGTWVSKRLEARNASAVEELRTELRLLEEREGGLFRRRFDALAEVYAALADADDAFGRWTRILREGGAPSKDEDGERAVAAYDSLLKSLNRNRLWLGPELAKRADEFIAALHEAWVYFIDRDTRDWKRVTEVMSQRGPEARRAFEHEADRMLNPPRDR